MEEYTSIKEAITAELPGAQVHIFDPRNDGVHLEAVVVAAEFEEMPLFKQHQVVMNSLKAQFDSTLHALKLKTMTPKEWEAQNA